jgi:hypothetical protein
MNYFEPLIPTFPMPVTKFDSSDVVEKELLPLAAKASQLLASTDGTSKLDH